MPGAEPGTATMAQLAASQPLEKLQRPETLKPPLTISALPPAGLRQLLASVSGPLRKNSSWACSGKWPSHQLWTSHSEQHQAVDPHARPSSQATA